MRRAAATVVETAEIYPGTFATWYDAPALAQHARPGQFVMVDPGFELGSLDPLLPRAFSYYRFRSTKLRDDVGANSIQLAELSLFADASRMNAVSVTNPGGNNPAGEQPPMADDANVSTKWLDFNRGALLFATQASQLSSLSLQTLMELRVLFLEQLSDLLELCWVFNVLDGSHSASAF